MDIHPICHIDGLVQDCSNSSVLAMELLQSSTKPSICHLPFLSHSPLERAIGHTHIYVIYEKAV